MPIRKQSLPVAPWLFPRILVHRMPEDYHAVSNLIVPSAMPIPNLEEVGRHMAEASVFCTLICPAALARCRCTRKTRKYSQWSWLI